MLAAALLLSLQAPIQGFTEWVQGIGPWAPVIYGAAYAVATVALAPGAPFSIGAGLLFGAWGVPVALVGATVGAALSFLVSRYLAGPWVRRMIDRRPALAAVDRAVAEEGWRIVGLMRLSPLVPFNLQNYFFGVTRIGFWPYVLATGVGIVPGAALYVYLGAVGRAAGAAGPLQWAAIVAGLAATAAVTVLVGRRARALLAEKSVWRA